LLFISQRPAGALLKVASEEPEALMKALWIIALRLNSLQSSRTSFLRPQPSAFIMAGEHGKILTLLDGIAWALRNTGVRTNPSVIAYENDNFMTVGTDGTIVQSIGVAPLRKPATSLLFSGD